MGAEQEAAREEYWRMPSEARRGPERIGYEYKNEDER
jgi:hypothetical protein